jgi:hypothetical protein
MTFKPLRLSLGLLAYALITLLPAQASPVQPQRDNEVLERLPLLAPWARDARVPRIAQQAPRDLSSALLAARQFLELARSQGDARYAGQALGSLQAWPSTAKAPVEVLVMRASVEQYLHQFTTSEATLRLALAQQALHPQAWLTLASLQRLRGDYPAAAESCGRLSLSGADFYARACRAETESLGPAQTAARTELQGLLLSREAGNSQSLRAWLLTSLALLEEMTGDDRGAELHYRAVLALADPQADSAGYARLAFVDLLLRLQRGQEVPALLGVLPRSDAVLLRLAIVQRQNQPPRQSKARQDSADATELVQRFAAIDAANTTGTSPHAREQARFALDVQAQPLRALTLAQRNVQTQREPEDLLLLARAAVAAGNTAALAQARQLLLTQGLRDARIDAVL